VLPLAITLSAVRLQRPRWGHRFLHWALTKEGWQVDLKEVYRLYGEEGLRIRRRRRKHVALEAGCGC
jgi:transposase InsO family protein